MLGIIKCMKKEIKTKKMTIDKLAVMVAKSFKNMATKDDIKNMATKDDIKTQQDVLQIMLKEIKAIHEDSKFFKDTISTLYIDHIAYDRKIENLTVRVEKIELNLENKLK